MTQEEMHEWREEMRMDAYQDEMHDRCVLMMTIGGTR